MKFYAFWVIVLVFALPIISISIALHFSAQGLTIDLMEQWFIFWAIGARLFSAGIVQVVNPQFTLQKVLALKNIHDDYSVIRELGFANISIGIISMFSLVMPALRLASACIGGLFLGLCGLLHVLKWHKAHLNEKIAAISDLFICVMVLIFIIQSL